jgi:phthalate 4,5-cis-dihydrodiol dehydrogenase
MVQQGGPNIRIGVAGLGAAFTNMMRELAAYPHGKVTAAADLRQRGLDKFASEWGGETYATVEEMCASPNVDVVYVLTPDRFHAEHAIAAAEHGKHIVLDKPMGQSLEECDRIIEAVERNHVRVVVGHSQSLDQPIIKMAEVVNSGQIGKPIMIHTSFFSDWVYRPRAAEELDPALGGGVVRRQGPIQVDIARMMGGGMVRSARAMTSVADSNRPVEGSMVAYLEFEDSTPATLVYSGYGHFDSTLHTWGVGLQGFEVDSSKHGQARKLLKDFTPEDEWAHKEETRYGGTKVGQTPHRGPDKRHAFFGVTIVECEHGSVRQSPNGLTIYGDDEIQELPVSAGDEYGDRYTTSELNLVREAIANDAPPRLHGPRWAKATQEVVFGILDSAAQRKEVYFQHQVPFTAF